MAHRGPMDGQVGHPGDGAATPPLVLEATSWYDVPAPSGVHFVIVGETSPVSLIQENLTVDGFDPEAPPVDAGTAEAFRPTLHGCAAVTVRWRGVPLAAGMFTPIEDGRCELVGITTLEPYRRRGFGAAVTCRLVRTAIESGAITLFLVTGDETARRVYRRLGFHEA